MAQTLYTNPPGTGAVSNAQIDPQLAQYATVSLSAAQIQAMTTPVLILAAPGSGKAIVVNEILFEMTTTGTAFANGGPVSFVYHGGVVPCHAGVILASVVNAGAGTTLTQLGPPVAGNGTTIPTNTGVDITNITAPFITGTGTAKVQIAYAIITQ